jgi:hypothetical protein
MARRSLLRCPIVSKKSAPDLIVYCPRARILRYAWLEKFPGRGGAMKLRMLAAIPALMLAITAGLAACGSGGPAASSLAAKVGCGNVTQAPQDSDAQQDIDCDLPGGSAVEIATFGNSTDRNSWIASQPASSCCAAGNLWAATVTPGGSEPVGPMLQNIASKLGGQQVKAS